MRFTIIYDTDETRETHFFNNQLNKSNLRKVNETL